MSDDRRAGALFDRSLLEPEVQQVAGLDRAAVMSIAISLRRIADALADNSIRIAEALDLLAAVRR